ncbi:unnamed protein product [Anisakis simplex]|uniref:Uncharacterized protein n=1 Tax=Anisakis simplex TaxID=6269 RepID=A0A0M3JES4_ANISI|nr:unnamed protein product [Anisakis simplex]
MKEGLSNCQRSDVEVVGFKKARNNEKETPGGSSGKAKLRRPSEPNKWKRTPKRKENIKSIPVAIKNS